MSLDDSVLDNVIQAVAGKAHADEVRVELGRYASDEDEGTRRVRLAILKLVSEEGLDRLQYYVDVAKQDFRDVVAWAEYPAQMKASPNLPEPEMSALVRADKEQYEAWLTQVVGTA